MFEVMCFRFCSAVQQITVEYLSYIVNCYREGFLNLASKLNVKVIRAPLSPRLHDQIHDFNRMILSKNSASTEIKIYDRL
jgi:hypothetical protein